MYCASDQFIATIGSLFFVGALVGSLFLPRMADIIGRKPIFVIGLVLHILTMMGILYSSNRYFLLAFIFFAGISEVGRYYVAYVYGVEVLPKRLANDGGLIIFICMSF